MIKKISSLIILSSSLLAYSAMAKEYYIRFDAGYSEPNAKFVYTKLDFKNHNKNFKNTFKLNVGLGYDFDNNFRADVNLFQTGKYKASDLEESANFILDNNASIKATSLMINGYYDFESGMKLKPYLTAGIGLSKVSAEKESDLKEKEEDNEESKVIVKDSNYNFVWQIGVGVSYPIQKNIFLDASYRLIDNGSFFKKESVKGKNGNLITHNFLIGVRVNL